MYSLSPQTESAYRVAIIFDGDPTNLLWSEVTLGRYNYDFNAKNPKVKPFFYK